MVPHDALINALRESGYTFKRQTSRVQIYKKRGGIGRVTIGRRRTHAPEAARSILRHAGMDDEGIERFLSTCLLN